MTSVTAFMHGRGGFALLCLESHMWPPGHLDGTGAVG
ncbi:hypothetical protein STVIR_0958 [Streptomyces viridochromogenes Tue57]|uniref:Uncharacterized protein n=1 Tax=Streptomyces viridochromogenes Tue57 TaxID=1160705 RepID=L8PN62_STRVR|nr:hypothetical protein STVIR_0958 [Streptomyces viridochromogenes Tue57]